MSQQILRIHDVKARTGLSRSTIYSRIAEQRFPQSVPLGSAHVVGWLEGEIDLWIEERVRESRSQAP